MKYIDADRLRTEIERNTPFHHRVYTKIILALIDYLQQEQPEVDLEKEIEKEWKECDPIDEGMGVETANIHIEAFGIIARHFYELGKTVNDIDKIAKIRQEIERRKSLLAQHSKLTYDLILEIFIKEYDSLLSFLDTFSEASNKSLVEAAKKTYPLVDNSQMSTEVSAYYNAAQLKLQNAFRAGAEWQKNQMMKDAANKYDAGFKAGSRWLAEQGVSVEANIRDCSGSGYLSLVMPNNLNNRYKSFNDGDRVIVQIRKKEESK